jgi:uncharacterized protein YkwD
MSQHRARAQLEHLEDRCLPSGIAYDSNTGFVTVTGREQADRITMQIADGRLRVTLADRATGQVLAQQDFAPESVRRLEVRCGDGDDVVINDTAIRMVAYGEGGDDYLEGGSGNDRLQGGAGNDLLVGFVGKDKLLGDEGNDVLFGLQGKDFLDGGPGDDSLHGGLGNDSLADAAGANLLDQFTDGELRTLYEPFGSSKLAAYFSTQSGPLSGIERRIFQLLNQERTQAGVSALALSSRLIAAAQHHAANMARFDRLAHDLPEADLPGLRDRLEHYRYRFRVAGENVAFGYPDAEAVVRAWMNSPSHRSNLLSTDYTEIGVGVRYNRQGRAYFCLVFGTSL